MKIPDDETSRVSEEECPGSPDLESVLVTESVGNAASHRGASGRRNDPSGPSTPADARG
jgi:hypothetical protein